MKNTGLGNHVIKLSTNCKDKQTYDKTVRIILFYLTFRTTVYRVLYGRQNSRSLLTRAWNVNNKYQYFSSKSNDKTPYFSEAGVLSIVSGMMLHNIIINEYKN